MSRRFHGSGAGASSQPSARLMLRLSLWSSPTIPLSFTRAPPLRRIPFSSFVNPSDVMYASSAAFTSTGSTMSCAFFFPRL